MTPLFMPPKDGTYIGDQLLVGAVAVQMPDGSSQQVVVTIDPRTAQVVFRAPCGCTAVGDLLQLSTEVAHRAAGHEIDAGGRDGTLVH